MFRGVSEDEEDRGGGMLDEKEFELYSDKRLVGKIYVRIVNRKKIDFDWTP